MRALIRVLEDGDQIVITPDGPRGPAREAAAGVAQLAALTQAPIIPCAAQTSARRVLATWDRMVLPLPFGRGVLVCAAPIAVPRDAWNASLPQIEGGDDGGSPAGGRLVRGMIPAAWHWGATLGVPLLERMLDRRVVAGKEDAARLNERRGYETGPRPPGRLLWLHAASIGEAVSVLPMLLSLQRQDPALTTLFTTGTLTSARLPGNKAAGARARPCAAPVRTARRAGMGEPLSRSLAAGCRLLRRERVMAEFAGRQSAPWDQTDARQCPHVGGEHATLAPGGRLRTTGDRRLRLRHAQSPEYAGRLRHLGARNLLSPGNLKRAAPPLPVDPDEAARLTALIGARPIWLAASTHPGEEALAGAVHRRLAADHPGLLTIIAPRHPERAAPRSLPRSARTSRPNSARPAAASARIRRRVGSGWRTRWGELGLLYALAPIVFVGRSLAGEGGQNPLEPARFGAALAVGPHTGNFVEISEMLLSAGGMVRVADGDALADWVDHMLRDPASRAAAGRAARAVADGEQALPDRGRRRLAGAHALIPPGLPPGFWHRDGVVPLLLSPVAALVSAVTRHRMRQAGWRAPVPVLCCGNAGVGGTGKTTLVLDLAWSNAGPGHRGTLPDTGIPRPGSRRSPRRSSDPRCRAGRRRTLTAGRGGADLGRGRPGRVGAGRQFRREPKYC